MSAFEHSLGNMKDKLAKLNGDTTKKVTFIFLI